ncbi:MAG TPA: alpha/beta hydrolase [Terriglobales bacterium]|nr:alpha/beta hydrolase [Terriglobales bacterium]
MHHPRLSFFVAALVAAFIFPACVFAAEPAAPGRLVDLGGHKLHVNCTGKGSPTVVVENGLGDYSFDWFLVQQKVAAFARVCTYDRAGYAWSDPGPKPRTFAQINLELHDALTKLGEHGPFVLVGHSYGGPVARNFALTYRNDVAAMVFVDAAHEGLRVPIGDKKTLRLGDDAKGTPIPAAHETLAPSDKPTIRAEDLPAELKNLDPMFKPLPEAQQQMQLWAQQQPGVYDAQQSETQWSGEYFAKWLASPQAGTLGSIPVIVLSRAEGGYGDLDVPAAQLEQERKDGQRMLTGLSANSRQIFVRSGHNMELEAPDEVAKAIQAVVNAVRHKTKL